MNEYKVNRLIERKLQEFRWEIWGNIWDQIHTDINLHVARKHPEDRKETEPFGAIYETIKLFICPECGAKVVDIKKEE